MRGFFIAALMALIGSVGLVALIETDPGYVLISYGLTTIESSLWIALLLLILLNTLAVYLFKLVRSVISSGGSFSRWLQDRRLEKGRKLTAQGVLSYFRGDWRKARRTLLQSVASSPQPAVNLLLSAQSSAHLGEIDKAEEFYLELETGEFSDSQLVAISRAGDYLKARQYQLAAETLNDFKKLAATNTLILNLLRDAYCGSGDWDALVTLLPQLKKAKTLAAEDYQALASQAYLGLLNAAQDAQQLEKSWSACPDDIRLNTEILSAYIGNLLQQGSDLVAEKMLLKSIKRNWDSNLIRLFGLTAGANANKQLQRAESWLPAHADDAELLLCLGRLSLRNQLWGKARNYFESSQHLQPSAETCAELARLLFSLGEREKSAQCYRQGLLVSTGRLPNLPLPK